MRERCRAEQVPAQQAAVAIRTEQLFLIRPNPDNRLCVLNLTTRFGRAKPTLWLSMIPVSGRFDLTEEP
jgi:hypothetical protein